ncbi:GTP cyclohydrolase II RibA [Enterovirga rhinocerotis]|uniref:GTP cyclohydrolase-2 n=1 Tax=Enterovirga rhinocerotis TaxID=1339210 RepID=A0A4R7C038_9HYPH|nr:GTP cyclohydrolase II RibA [Enterovirga rhinocerotis]TDR89736.1 GTP cyclohydrolase II [Enterovirga rhinocerotis]
MRLTLSLSEPHERTSVERAIAEMRMGRPVLLDGQERGSILVQGLEDLTPERAAELDVIAAGAARLVLPAARLRRLGLQREGNGAVALPSVDPARIATLAFEIDARVDAPVHATEALDEDALELARLALSLPAIVVIPLGPSVAADASVLRVAASAVHGYRADRVRDLVMVARSPVPLADAHETEFVVFRGGEGLRDQVAIIVGKPDPAEPVIIRLHSACLTGDLFGSLKCDCGDQLRTSVRYMAEQGGGVLLYLDQEGRGNGIANKIRAYKLQAQGYDTYDADEMLGFGPDQRRFDFAARMLEQLGIRRVRLITNNPDKIEALAKSGIQVVSHERVFGRTTAENTRYLTSKRDRFGHLIELAGERPRKDG